MAAFGYTTKVNATGPSQLPRTGDSIAVAIRPGFQCFCADKRLRIREADPTDVGTVGVRMRRIKR